MEKMKQLLMHFLEKILRLNFMVLMMMIISIEEMYSVPEILLCLHLN